MYLRYRTRTKPCEEMIEVTSDDGTKIQRRCGVEFQTTNPAQKYCPEHKAKKPWSTPAVKTL